MVEGLKIIDDFNLDELNLTFGFGKGFRKCGDSYYQWKHLFVLEDRSIRLVDRVNGDCTYDDSLMKLFDLIKNGLVEKY